MCAMVSYKMRSLLFISYTINSNLVIIYRSNIRTFITIIFALFIQNKAEISAFKRKVEINFTVNVSD